MNKKLLLLLPILAFFLFLSVSCGKKTEISSDHVHSYGAWEETVPPSCLQEGKKVRTCACGETEEEQIPALGHEMTAHPGQAPTCTEKGWEAYETCSRCGASTYQELPKLPHELIEHAAKEPTCMQAGWTAYKTCKNCLYTTKKTLDALGHDWETEYTVDVEPTYESVGRKSIHCSRCAFTKDAKEIEKVQSGYVFYLKNRTGVQLYLDCEAEIFDETGAFVCEERFIKGICGADLEPGNYNLKLKGLPKGYFAQEAGYPFDGNEMVFSFKLSSSVIEGEAPERTRYKVGDVLYDFTAVLEGKTYRLSELTKQYDLILLNFWASWCGPCMSEMPMLQETYQKYQKSVFVMGLSIEPSDTAKKIGEIKREKGLTFPLGSDRDNDLWQYFDTGAIPTCVYIDANGMFVSGKGFAFEEIFSIYAKPDSALEESAKTAKILQGEESLPPKREEI